MNEAENFLNFGAVCKINRFQHDLENFIKLFKNINFLREYIDYFEKGLTEKIEDNEGNTINIINEDKFWHLVQINGGDVNNTCIEFQWGKGFTFGNGKHYREFDDSIKFMGVNELIKSFRMEELFNFNSIDTSFSELFKDKELEWLDEDLVWDGWSIQLYKDDLVNVYDTQCNEFRFEEGNVDKKAALENMLFRNLDVYIDQTEWKELVEEENADSIYEKVNYLLTIAKKYEFLKKEDEDIYINFINEVKEYAKEKKCNEIS